jgi:adenosine deaminase
MIDLVISHGDGIRKASDNTLIISTCAEQILLEFAPTSNLLMMLPSILILIQHTRQRTRD